MPGLRGGGLPGGMPLSWSVAALVVSAVAVLGGAEPATGGARAGRHSTNVSVDIAFPNDFLFGFASAPAQTEDLLSDGWLAFAREGHVAAWNNTPFPANRTNFWSHPELDIHIARDAGAQILRMGVSWTRLCPEHPAAAGVKGVQDWEALASYSRILELAKASGMRIMITLFHHSIPMWAAEDGGWTNRSTVHHFTAFASDVVDALGDRVAFWNTFNEPTVFALMTYCTGMWPPGLNPGWIFNQLECLNPVVDPGNYWVAMENIQDAHAEFWRGMQRRRSNASDSTGLGLVGVAHSVAIHEANSVMDRPANAFIDSMMTYPFADAVAGSVDFMGLNYYGKEITSGTSVAILPNQEYSESGRAVYPNGISTLLEDFNARYNGSLPFFITENGISDRTDVLRPSYLIEHLYGIRAAMDRGVRVLGYIHWSVSDNWEWADGYCPKFGIAEVDRENGMARIMRRSTFELFRNITTARMVAGAWRDAHWQTIVDQVRHNATRPFCRAEDGKSSLNSPVQRPFAHQDWRFSRTPYEPPRSRV